MRRKEGRRIARGYPTIRQAAAEYGSASGLLGRLVLVVFLVEFFPRNLLLGHLRKLNQEVDDLLLIDRRAQARDRLRIVAVVLPNLLLLAWELACPLDDGALHLFVRHLDLVLVADLGDHQPEPHAPLGDL